MMASHELFCARCALPAPIEDDMRPCTACGYTVFVPARWLDWELALSENDRKFLRSIRISTT